VKPDEIYLASFPFGGSAGMKLRPVPLLTGLVGSVPEVLIAYMDRYREEHRRFNIEAVRRQMTLGDDP
jgi:hypothetical protein